MTGHGQSFAAKLRLLREAAALSQGALAARAGMTRQAVSFLESGEREPSWVSVQRLALALGVSCDAFIDPGLTLPDVPPPRKPGRPSKVAAETGGATGKPKKRKG